METKTQTAEAIAEQSEATGTDADSSRRDAFTRLADRGEEALERLSGFPGGTTFARAAHTLREQLEDMSRRVRGIDELEKRLAELEHRVAELEQPPSSPPPSTAPPTP